MKKIININWEDDSDKVGKQIFEWLKEKGLVADSRPIKEINIIVEVVED